MRIMTTATYQTTPQSRVALLELNLKVYRPELEEEVDDSEMTTGRPHSQCSNRTGP